ncbi:MAG: ribosome-binding factor A [Patescibacteria group bacterium]|nr:ribosome-binding factor A [Patescibacteria group bacterium]
MRFHRAERVNKLIREELSRIIGKEMEFPAGALVTLTAVETDKKMEHAKVGVSVLPESAAPDAMRALERKTGWLQHLLFKTINIRPMPMVVFKLDRGNENAADVERAFLEEEDR